MVGGPNININFGNPQRRRRRRRMAGGLGGLIGLLVLGILGYSKVGRPAPVAPPLPASPAALRQLQATAVGKNLEQISATVVDQGPLRLVPYLSYRAGDVEFNAYGDPDQPACLEIGIFGPADPANRAAIREALAGLLPDPADRDAVRALNPAGGKTTRGRLTLEITPETAPDAYGGWWVSVYDVRALDAARASDGEMKDLAKPSGQEVKSRRTGRSVYPRSYRRLNGLYRTLTK
jgi:hypothetical protein